MKVLLDPIYSTRPSKCSSAVKCRKLLDYVLFQKGRTDIYFRQLVPDWLFEEKDEHLTDMAWFLDHPNVEYIPFKYSHDRMRGYQVFTESYYDLMAFDGTHWDTDFVLTMRTQQVPNMQVVMSSPRQVNQEFLKKVFLYEEMPVMEFKPTVAVANPKVQDLATLCGYLSADHVLILVQSEKDDILRTARKYFTPSKVIELDQKIKVACPAVVDSFELKAPEKRFRKDGDRPFRLGFTGRASSPGRLPEVYRVMERNWVLKGDEKFEAVYSTVSVSVKWTPPPCVKVMHLPREEFWELLRTGMDLHISLSKDASFSMSFTEPLMLGVPSVAVREPWSLAVLGPDYPFFVKNEVEAYAMVRTFYDNYDEMYARFAEWHTNVFRKRFETGGPYELNYYEEMYKAIDAHSHVHEQFAAQFPGKQKMKLAAWVNEYAKYKEEFDLREVLKALSKDRVFTGIDHKIADDAHQEMGIVWTMVWNEVRMALKGFYGWRDASPRVGHFAR